MVDTNTLQGIKEAEAKAAKDDASAKIEAQRPGAAWIFDKETSKWIKPEKPTSGNKTYAWDNDKGWVESGVDTSKLTASTGFVLSKVLIEDPIYGTGPRGLKAVYDAWARGDETEALNLYFQSDYYTKLGKTASSRFALSKNQPEVYAADLNTYISDQKARLRGVGVKVDDEDLNKWLKQAYDGNLSNSQLDALIVKSKGFGTSFGGDILSQTETLKQYARAYGLSYTDAKFNQWGADLFSGKITDSEIQKAIQTEAASKFPALADQIMKGVTVDALASAYKSSMATLLEIDADSIGYDDPTLLKALQYVGPDGKPSSKPLWQFESDLRSDVRWQFTNNARDSIDSMQYKVMKDWGLI